MAVRLALLGVRAIRTPKTPVGAMSMSGHGSGAPDYLKDIGQREIVGYGINGNPVYTDRTDFPMPAIRYKEPTPDMMSLREKEKGDWKKLSLEEKKALYRFSYCQTFSEMKAPSPQWKQIAGVVLMLVSAGLWLFYGIEEFVYPPLPESFKEENRRAQLRRMIDLQVNPIQGLASKWDYEKDEWKK
ncbi:cytochrome c oxidase subunit 4 isoform 1, mitochondrial-like [Coccinella septempunctata]|uniref:cytochrome c oxidase subunit 4 isoform 1, mitochondrial-like n=1 Tax=Coccinella septempunctata TaxID=41139 RepID=UPI001D072B6A|nr:cytochrome c oxidase subunit 4 isoform 1, mitochondrial-like [Coccinella septempunctata]